LNIKRNFEKLSSKEIIQLYLIVVMLYGLIFVFYKELSHLIYPIESYKPSIIKIETDSQHHIKKLSDFDLLTYFNNKSKDQKIEIIETKILESSIEIKMIGAFENIMNILNDTSTNFKVKKFEIKKVENKIDLLIQLDRQMYTFIQNGKLKKEKIFNPFLIERVQNEYIESKIILSAIVNLEILVNNNWYKKGDRIKEYLVLFVKKNEVLFLNTKTKKKIVKRIIYE